MTKQATLMETPEPAQAALVPASDSGLASVVERLAANPAVDVTKLEKIIELQERVLRANAKAAFDAAFAKMQQELPAIDEKGQIKNRDGSVRNKYARLEDIQAAVKPVLARFGFALRHRTEWPGNGLIRIVGILAHEQGHAEESAFEAPMDRSDFRTDVQAQGSTVSYGRRYTTIDLLNIETRGTDDDGRKAGRPQPPDGYDEWIVALSETASKGLPAVEKMFTEASKDYRLYLTQHDADAFKKIRERARTGKAAQ